MKKFIKSFLTNRLGLFFAIANLFVITINRSGISGLLGLDNFVIFSFILNLPARIASTILFEVILFPKRQFTKFDLNYYSLEMLIFVIFQWIFIGWLATIIAKNLRKINQQ